MTFQVGNKTNSPWRKQTKTLFASVWMTCENVACGKSFKRQRSQPRGAHTFCSRECHTQFRVGSAK